MGKEHFPLSLEEVGPRYGRRAGNGESGPRQRGLANFDEDEAPALTCNAPCSPTAITLPSCEYR
jgi:hypothetical protein